MGKIFVGNHVKWQSKKLQRERIGRVVKISGDKLIVIVLNEELKNPFVWFENSNNLTKCKK